MHPVRDSVTNARWYNFERLKVFLNKRAPTHRYAYVKLSELIVRGSLSELYQRKRWLENRLLIEPNRLEK